MERPQKHRPTERLLASQRNIGCVRELETGAIEIAFEGQALRLSADRYWTFMELMSEASRQFVVSPRLQEYANNDRAISEDACARHREAVATSHFE